MAGHRGSPLTGPEADVADAIAMAGAAGLWPGASSAEALAGWLYAHWYCGSTAADGVRPAASQLPSLAGRLTAVHGAYERWERWQVAEVHRDWLTAERAGQSRIVAPGEYRHADRPCVPPAVGESVMVAGRITVEDEASGFWASQRNVDPPPEPLVRVYWNVGADSVVPVVRSLTAALEATTVDFAMKAPGDPAGYDRVDALVLYAPRAQAGEVGGAVRATLDRLESPLDERTPRLTRRLAPGCAWAEDPPGPTSFGWHRCGAVAAGMMAAAGEGAVDGRDAVVAVLAGFAARGIDPDRPYRNLPADDDLELSATP